MTPLAILFMCVAVGSVTALAAWCYYRVLFGRGNDGDQRQTQRERR